MKKLVLVGLFFSAQVLAAAEVKLDEHPGSELFDETCASGCHFHTTDEIFVRKDRKAKDRAQLSTWVSNCITQTGVEVFPEDEEQIEEFLNKKYYHY